MYERGLLQERGCSKSKLVSFSWIPTPTEALSGWENWYCTRSRKDRSHRDCSTSQKSSKTELQKPSIGFTAVPETSPSLGGDWIQREMERTSQGPSVRRPLSQSGGALCLTVTDVSTCDGEAKRQAATIQRNVNAPPPPPPPVVLVRMCVASSNVWVAEGRSGHSQVGPGRAGIAHGNLVRPTHHDSSTEPPRLEWMRRVRVMATSSRTEWTPTSWAGTAHGNLVQAVVGYVRCFACHGRGPWVKAGKVRGRDGKKEKTTWFCPPKPMTHHRW